MADQQQPQGQGQSGQVQQIELVKKDDPTQKRKVSEQEWKQQRAQFLQQGWQRADEQS